MQKILIEKYSYKAESGRRLTEQIDTLIIRIYKNLHFATLIQPSRKTKNSCQQNTASKKILRDSPMNPNPTNQLQLKSR